MKRFNRPTIISSSIICGNLYQCACKSNLYRLSLILSVSPGKKINKCTLETWFHAFSSFSNVFQKFSFVRFFMFLKYLMGYDFDISLFKEC